MDFLTMAQIAGTGLKFVSALQGGQAAQDQAAFDNYQTELKINQDKIVGRQKMNLRNAQFAANESINRATFLSGMNRDISDKSFRAFMERQRLINAEDVESIEAQTTMSVSQLKTAQKATSLRADQAKQAALLGAGSAIASGLFRYEQYRVGESLFD
jgi:folate-dependent tRNA-U54 methylase TrmFO/GidA